MSETKTRAFALIVVLIIIGTIMGIATSYVSLKKGKELAEERGCPFENKKMARVFAMRYMASIVVISINIMLLIGLLLVYMDTYSKTKSSFMLGLVFFISVLLIQSLLSLPLIHALFGYTPYGLGPFGVVPHLFETVALVILMALSME
ncbi:MAG: hypothetical protein U9O96_07380 [Candidatus Thermoplasmatota archaeon]|nr:hypothetical protein [Candidatus Thermoplasmatota archaeon]